MEVTQFIAELEKIKLSDEIYYVPLNEKLLYAYDVRSNRRTYLTADISDREKGLELRNDDEKMVHHVCVDGGMVTYGLWDYVGDGEKHGRFDCMLFNEQKLMLVEFKMDSTTDRDKGKWALFSDGMKQIREYYIFLKGKLVENGSDLAFFFSNEQIVPYICMSNLPDFKPKANVQRMTEMVKFKDSTGLIIQYGTKYSF